MQPVFRFAPSPNGELHLGHAHSALVDFDLCRQAQGCFLLRIEDIDRSRCRPEFEALIYEDLAWLGLTWQTPVWRQSERMTTYTKAVERLTEMGLLYPSFMSRGEVRAAAAGRGWPRDPDGTPLYPGNDRDLDHAEAAARIAAGASYALRLRMDEARAVAGPLTWIEEGNGDATVVTADPAAWGDVLLARREMPTSYHLAVVVDDAAQSITHVVRGRDLYHATSVHVLLQRLLGLPSPAYHHHKLVLDSDGRKLSKSDGDSGLRSLREAGRTAGDIRALVGI